MKIQIRIIDETGKEQPMSLNLIHPGMDYEQAQLLFIALNLEVTKSVATDLYGVKTLELSSSQELPTLSDFGPIVEGHIQSSGPQIDFDIVESSESNIKDPIIPFTMDKAEDYEVKGRKLSEIRYGQLIYYRCHSCYADIVVETAPYKNSIQCPHCKELRQVNGDTWLFRGFDATKCGPLSQYMTNYRRIIWVLPAKRAVDFENKSRSIDQVYSFIDLDVDQEIWYTPKQSSRKLKKTTVQDLLDTFDYNLLAQQFVKWQAVNQRSYRLVLYSTEL